MTVLRERLAPTRRLRELRREFDRAIFVLAAGDLVASFGFSLVFPFLTIYLTAELGATALAAGAVVGLYAVVSIVSNAVGGWLADRVGRKPVMVVSIILTAATVAAMGLVRDLAWVAALTLLLGLVDPPFVPAARAAVADVVPVERRPRAYGLLAMASSVGWIAGPSVGAGLSNLGYGVLFVTAGVIIAGYAVILVVGLRETRPGIHPAAGVPGPADVAGQAGEGGPGIAGEGAPALPAAPPASSPPAGAAVRGGARPLGPRRILALFLLLAVAVHAASFQWVVTLPIHAHARLDVSTATWGLLFALNGILIFVFQLRVASLAERRSRPRFMAVGMAWYGLGYLVIGIVPGTDLAIAALAGTVVLATLGEMFVFPVETSFVSELSPPALRGRYQGYLGAAMGLGSAIGPVAGGLVLDVAPGATLWLATAATCAGIAAGLWWLGGRVPTAPDEGGTTPV